MLNKISGSSVLLLGNLIPFLHFIIIFWSFFLDLSLSLRSALIVFEIYFLPPLLTRILFVIYTKPEGTYDLESIGFKVWWLSSQLQANFLRFQFLEELLRVIPLAYSFWLRLWGAEIGKRVYWSPRAFILDRSHLSIGDSVIIGYGAGMTAHHFNRDENSAQLILAKPFVGSGAVLGGLSGLGPGARVAANEMLPSTLALAPFYEWRGSRRYSLQNPNKTSKIEAE